MKTKIGSIGEVVFSLDRLDNDFTIRYGNGLLLIGILTLGL